MGQYRRKLGRDTLERDAGRLRTVVGSSSGGAGTAPNDAKYLTLATDTDLTQERVFTDGDGLVGTDGGGGSTYTLDVDLVAAWSGLEFSGGELRVDEDAAFAWTNDHSWTSSTSAKPLLTLENTNADALSPIIDFYKNSASPADGDMIGRIDFSGETSTGAKECYASIVGASLDVTNGDTGGGIHLAVMMDGVKQSLVYIGGYNGFVNQGEVVINAGALDVDFLVLGVGGSVDLGVQATDGQITLGALGAGFVQSSALGVLSSAAIIPGDLPAHTHAGAGEGGPLVVGTTDTGATAGSILFAGAAGVQQEDNAGLFYDDGNNRLAVGTNLPDEDLHVLSSAAGDGPTILVENTNAGISPPTFDFYKNSVSPADGDYLGAWDFYGNTSTGAQERYAYFFVKSLDVTNGDTGGGMDFRVVMDSTERSMLEIEGYNGSVNEGKITINKDGQDVDFKVEASGVADALEVQGSDGEITLGALGAGFVQSTAGGILSSAAIIAGDLPAHDHSGAGEGGSLVIGTTDTDATAGSIFFAGAAGVIQQDNARLFYDDTNDTLGIRSNIPHTLADALYVPWITGDTQTTATFGSSNAANDQIAIGVTSYSDASIVAQAQDASCIFGETNSSTATDFGVLGWATGAGGGVSAKSATGTALYVNITGAGTIAEFCDAGTADFTITPASFNVLSGSNISMADGSAIGITGNELLTFNAAGTVAASGIIGITVEDADFIGIGTAAARIAFYAAGHASFFNANVGLNKGTPATLLHADFSGHTPYAQNTVTGAVFLESDPNSGSGNFGSGIVFGEVSGSAQPHRGAALYVVQTSADGNDMGLAFATHDSTAGDPRIEAMRIDHDQNVVIGNTSPAAKLHVDQNSASAAIPALLVDQADVSEGFINYVAASAASVANPISTWTTGNTIQGFVRIEINGANYWMPYYDAPTS